MATKAYVRINSTMNINVTSGLQANDLTKKDSDIENRLKVQPMWSSCFMKKGTHTYPSNIMEWTTVKTLIKDEILTFVSYTDSASDGEDEVVLKRQKAILDNEEKKVKELNLSSIAGA